MKTDPDGQILELIGKIGTVIITIFHMFKNIK